MIVLSEIENHGLKGYLVQDNGQKNTADIIFVSKKPRSRVIVDIVKEIKGIIEDRKGKITHPAYIKYFDVKQINEEYCLIREDEEKYQPLLSFIMEHNPSLDKKVEWAITLAEVLKEAENQGVQLPPVGLQSLWIDKNGNIKVYDPEIIDLIEQYRESNLPYPPQEIYYPPEYYRKQGIDERGRIYSVGVILYYLLTGKAPFTSEDKADLIDEIMNTEPVEPCYLNAQISTRFNNLILQILERDREKRIKNWSKLLNSLKELLNKRAVEATEAERAQHQARANKILKVSRRKRGFRSFWRKRWKVMAVVAVAVAVFFGIGFMNETVPVVTTETAPEQVVNLFYEGIDSKNFQYLEETCTVELKNLERLVMETYVIEKTRSAYSTAGTEDKIFGINNLDYRLISNGEQPLFKANYSFYIYRAEDQKQEANMEDLLKLDKVEGKWQIVEINGDLNKIIAGQIDELLPPEQD